MESMVLRGSGYVGFWFPGFWGLDFHFDFDFFGVWYIVLPDKFILPNS
jgi:hypothetical protein